jgi:hypothetical protein
MIFQDTRDGEGLMMMQVSCELLLLLKKQSNVNNNNHSPSNIVVAAVQISEGKEHSNQTVIHTTILNHEGNASLVT